VRWAKHDDKWFVSAVKFFRPASFSVRGYSLNVADLIFGLGFDGWRNHHPVVIEAFA
jgi:hypothetical protein